MSTITQQAPNARSIYCPHCGQAMRVAPEHAFVAVACPSCEQTIQPWRIGGSADYHPQPQSPGYAQGARGYGYYSWRNRWVAGALAILLGVFGVHRFYMGFTGVGLLQLLITVCSLGILSPVVAVWTFVEGILCFAGAMRDVEGLPLRG